MDALRRAFVLFVSRLFPRKDESTPVPSLVFTRVKFTLPAPAGRISENTIQKPAQDYIAKVRFRPEPGSRRRTATKPVQDEPIWESSKLFKTLYNCFTIENDTAMPRFGRGVYALW